MNGKQIAMMMVATTMSGLGNTMQHLDADNKGLDDLGGVIAKEGSLVLMASATDQLHTARQAVVVLRDGCQQWLDDNPDPSIPDGG